MVGCSGGRGGGGMGKEEGGEMGEGEAEGETVGKGRAAEMGRGVPGLEERRGGVKRGREEFLVCVCVREREEGRWVKERQREKW